MIVKFVIHSELTHKNSCSLKQTFAQCKIFLEGTLISVWKFLAILKIPKVNLLLEVILFPRTNGF